MFTKPILAAAALALSSAAIVSPAPVAAQAWGDDVPVYRDGGFQTVGWRKDRRQRGDRRYYRGNDRCYDKGNGGLAIGGVVGGLIGHEVAGRNDKLLGALLGAGAGALAGRAIDKSDGARC